MGNAATEHGSATPALTCRPVAFTIAASRERPELFNASVECKGRGEPTHLVTAVQVGDRIWCTIGPFAGEGRNAECV